MNGKLNSAEIISETYADVYINFSMILVNIATILFLGILFQLFVPCILLNLSFIPLCIYADEHNVDSPVKCYICTC